MFSTFVHHNAFGQRSLAFEHLEGALPCVVWLGGYRSDMEGTKAAALRDWAQRRGQGFLRFDYTGHGRSDGDFETCCLSTWLDDCLAILSHVGAQDVVLVGSSMGGWLATLIARDVCAGRISDLTVRSMVLIAPAPDFTQDLMWSVFDEETRAIIQRDGVFYRPSPYSEQGDPITLKLIEDGRSHLVLQTRLRVGCPVQILHGDQDTDVPLSHVEAFVAHLPEDPITLSIVQGGDHRLSRSQDLELLITRVDEMVSV